MLPTWNRRDVLRRTVLGDRRGRHVVAAAALLMSYQAGEALVPVVIGGVVDNAIENADADALLRWLAALAGVFAVLSLSWRFGWRRATWVVESAEHDLRLLVTGRALDPGGQAGGDRLAGELLSCAAPPTAASDPGRPRLRRPALRRSPPCRAGR